MHTHPQLQNSIFPIQDMVVKVRTDASPEQILNPTQEWIMTPCLTQAPIGHFLHTLMVRPFQNIMQRKILTM